ncbi:MAG: hypothetical protein KDB07_00665, partial [Planctomycetes bacterium]|nr:hypothetical protein [Planctomycetota bacterium]
TRVNEEVRIREEQRRTQELLAQSKLNSYREEIRLLYSEAKSYFDRREYGETVNKLNQILRKDPFNAEVMELRSIAIRLDRTARDEAAERNFSRHWNTAIALLEDANVFPNEHLKWPTYELWQRVEDRWRRLRAEQEQDTSKEDAAVYAALESATVKFTFGSEDESVSLGNIISRFRGELSNVNFHIKGDVGDQELAAQDLGDIRLRSALEHIVRITGGEVRWRVENGTIYLTGSDERAVSQSRIFDVADILINLKDFRGVEPRLATDDTGDSRFGEDDEEEDEKDPLDGDALIELLTTVLEGAFDEEREPEIRGTQLAIYAPRETIQKVDDLLKSLRSSQGLVVNIEARFITIRDDFLEDIGIDFRGVGGSPSGTSPQPVAAVLDDVAFGTPSVPLGVGTLNDSGFFFQDISNGTAVDEDIRGRVENLFDQSVGGRRGGSGLTNSGGASFQLSFIDNPEITAVLRAVQKAERAILLTAPAISVHNTQRGNVSILNELKYIRDFNVNVSADFAVADPIIDVIRDGIVLDVRPTVSADRRYVTLELRPTLATLVRPIATIATSLGSGPPVSIQTPELQLQRLRTTVTIPDGGSFLIGGLRSVSETDLESGVPLLSDIPIIGWLFTRKAKVTERQDVIIIVSVTIVDLEEQVRIGGLDR